MSATTSRRSAIRSSTFAPVSRVIRIAMFFEPNRRTTPWGFFVPSWTVATSRT